MADPTTPDRPVPPGQVQLDVDLIADLDLQGDDATDAVRGGAHTGAGIVAGGEDGGVYKGTRTC